MSEEYSSCPYMTTVGKFQQQTIHEATGVTRQRQVQLATVQIFGRGIEAGRLYAAYASYDERGARKYWLLKTKSKAHPATKAPSPPSARWRAARPSGRAPW